METFDRQMRDQDVPRVLPLPPTERDAATQALLTLAGPRADKNVYTTLVRHPRLFERWIRFGAAMLYATLPDRDKELIILRTAYRTGCAYEWRGHTEYAAGLGVTEEEIECVQRGSDDPQWQAFDAALIRAVDELLDDHMISESTWAILADRYDETMLIELPMVVGHYYALGLTLNSLRVPLEARNSAQS
jgi:4-carboxymuconolactone decarboxylase